ncbi:MAG: phosphoribosylanthranilate isomerase [Bacteroidales bacterium]|nr:phosphoribosylanthranilate isomerase [Bacteroidales bacterium]
MLVKVCGLRDNFAEVASLKPDFTGLIFYPKSPRYVLQNADNELKKSVSGVKKVGVFVNEQFDRIVELAGEYNLDMVQLHGSESVDFCARLRAKIPVIKAFGISAKEDFAAAEEYAQYADYLLFDTKTKAYGGSGQKFDWSLFNGVSIPQRFFISGGISLSDIPSIKALKINNLCGIDLNSRFEIAPALKDIDLLEKAIKNIRQ